jgi:hypothetical protein
VDGAGLRNELYYWSTLQDITGLVAADRDAIQERLWGALPDHRAQPDAVLMAQCALGISDLDLFGEAMKCLSQSIDRDATAGGWVDLGLAGDTLRLCATSGIDPLSSLGSSPKLRCAIAAFEPLLTRLMGADVLGSSPLLIADSTRITAKGLCGLAHFSKGAPIPTTVLRGLAVASGATASRHLERRANANLVDSLRRQQVQREVRQLETERGLAALSRSHRRLKRLASPAAAVALATIYGLGWLVMSAVQLGTGITAMLNRGLVKVYQVHLGIAGLVLAALIGYSQVRLARQQGNSVAARGRKPVSDDSGEH